MAQQKIDKSTFEALLGEKIISFSISAGSKKSDGMAGVLKSIAVTTESGTEHWIILKHLPADDPGALTHLVHCRIMEKENEVYGSIIPELASVLSDHGLCPQLLPFPKYYGGTELYLAIEDLRPAGFKMADKFLGLNFKQVSLAVTALARFHATTFAYIRQYGEKVFHSKDIRRGLLNFPWSPKEMDPKYFADTFSMFQPMLEVLKRHNPQWAIKLDMSQGDFLKLFTRVFDRTDAEYFPVICHGDLWINNILFQYGGDDQNEEEPVDVKFIDLQEIHRGNIFEDLINFFGSSTTPAFRKDNLLPCLELYYASFVNLLESLSCPIPTKFTLGFLIDNYFGNLKSFAVVAGAAVSMQLSGGGDGEEDEKIVVEKSGKEGTTGEVIVDDAVDDNVVSFELHKIDPSGLAPLGSDYAGLGAFCKEMIEKEPRAMRRFLDIIQEMDDLGVLDGP